MKWLLYMCVRDGRSVPAARIYLWLAVMRSGVRSLPHPMAARGSSNPSSPVLIPFPSRPPSRPSLPDVGGFAVRDALTKGGRNVMSRNDIENIKEDGTIENGRKKEEGRNKTK